MDEYVNTLRAALTPFCRPDVNIQSQEHIQPFHSYGALRLILEGGFEPESVAPRPPLASTKKAAGKHLLQYAMHAATQTEAVVLGGLRSKRMDLTVRKPETGPVLGVSFKATTKAFRNLPNRVEELLGDATNIHLRYPAFVYGFCHIIKFATEVEAKERNDISFGLNGEPVNAVRNFHDLLTNLIGRARITDRSELYESVALLVVQCTADGPEIYSSYPPGDSPIHFSRFFEKLYQLYDQRYCFAGADESLCRKEWLIGGDAESRALRLAETQDADSLYPYTPRLRAE